MRKYMWILREYAAILKAHTLDKLYHHPPKAWESGQRGDVVIVHGYNDTGMRHRKLASTLNALGYKIHLVPELDGQRFPVKVASRKLADHIRRKELKNYFIIAHSKGCLVTKYAVYREDIPMPQKIFSIAPPFGGSVFGHLRLLSLHEMKPASPLLQELRKLTDKNHLFVSLYPAIDNMILVRGSSYLEGAENIQLDVNGHTLVIEDDRMIREIVDRIVAER